MKKTKRRSSFRTKILGVAMLASLLAVLSATAAMSVRDYISQNLSFRDHHNRLAQSLALTAAVGMAARPDAQMHEAFAMMARAPGVDSVKLAAPDGTILSSFVRNPDGLNEKPSVLFYAPVISPEGRVLGSVRLMARRVQPMTLLQNHLIVAGIILTLASGLSYLAALRLWPTVGEPLRELRRAMRRLAETKDYSSRLDRSPDGEVDDLIQAFNAMIAEIERRDLAYDAAIGELASARDAANRANRAKTQFLAVMSHELRTPLNAVIGYAELIKEELRHGADPHELIPDADRIRSSAQGLLEMINGILDMTTAEGGRMRVNWSPVDAGDLARDVTETLAPLAARKGNLMTVEILEQPKGFVTDEQRLRQCLVNLLGNAAKFTEQGEVGLRISMRYVPGAAPRVIFEVGDTGPGMSQQQVESLFQPFAQLDSSSARKHEGAGLGLAISRKLARLLGGDIHVRSVVGVGSVFSIDLPLAPPGYAAASREEPEAAAPARSSGFGPGEVEDAA
ncbi:ATP-binding protein [Neomegalonema perideroedes]|uniref:ATP-binding protein n=1 Tax=Neomegalonema perideroedes TaxID=217219 RepID=UPI0003A4BBF8|nr:ATP-binding protein [Neomegalonema perideroedes]